MKIKTIDGFKIRNTIDLDFSVIGDREVYPYINKGEVWLDKTFVKEKSFFIKLFNKRRRLIKKFGYEQAKKILRGKVKTADLKKIRIKFLKKIKGLTVYLVKGAAVREALDPNFCFGGHPLIYGYIPKKEVWIDNAAAPKERKYIILHELYEFNLIKRGMSYNNAHDYALAAEKEARRNDGIAHYLKD